jgi:hypothetical protein
MKNILFLVGFLTLIIISCKEEEIITAPTTPPPIVEDTINIQEEINTIVWDKLYGLAIYAKKGKYLLLNASDSSVKIINIGNDIGLNLKYNYFTGQITGMQFDNSNMNHIHYHLMSSDFNGHIARLYPNADFETYFYDWLPDGSLVYLNKSGKIYINGIVLNIPAISPSYNLACSPTENKIFVSTAKCDSIYCYFKIIEIDPATGEQNSILTNINSVFSEMPDMKYSPTTDRFLCCIITHSIPSGYSHYYLKATPNYLIKENGTSPNWSPLDWKQLTYVAEGGTYWKDKINGTTQLVIPDGYMLVWFK